MKWQIITSPAVEPVTVGDAMIQCRIADALYMLTAQDSGWLTNVAIPAARATAEAEGQRSLITQTIAATIYDQHDAALRPLHNEIRLPRGPVQSITSVVDGNSITINPSQYEIRRHGMSDFLFLKPSLIFPIVVTYVAGYGADGRAIPPDLKSMMLAHIAFLYDNRSADVDPTALDRVYRRYRSFAQ